MITGHVGPQPELTIEQAFWRFHHDNPHVYRRLVNLAREWRKRRGDDAPVGIGMLFEVLRWQDAMQTEGDLFRLNNNYRSYYARLIMDRNRDLDGIFHLRALHAAEPFYDPEDHGQLSIGEG